jgi:hypothetical protein
MPAILREFIHPIYFIPTPSSTKCPAPLTRDRSFLARNSKKRADEIRDLTMLTGDLHFKGIEGAILV